MLLQNSIKHVINKYGTEEDKLLLNTIKQPIR